MPDAIAPAPSAEALQITERQYLQERLDNQITWYSAKSAKCQDRHKSLRMTEVVAAALIPFIAGMGSTITYGAWITGALGALIAITAAASGIFKYHENWIQYRATSEQLKQEKFLFLARTGPYAGEDAFQALVGRIESLIAKENSTWTASFKPAAKPEGSA
jgi:hypothetical protein